MSQELLNQAVADSMKQDVPQFEVGDTVKVHCRIIEGEKQRIQMFIGTVIAKNNGGIAETFTVRRIVNNEGVERTFPVHSPKVADIEVVRRGKTRRAKLYYLRKRVGKATRLKEIREPSKKERAAEAAAKAKAEAKAKAAQEAAATETAQASETGEE